MAAMKNWPAKDPQAVLDYSYTIPLEAGDAVASHTFEKLSGDVVIDSSGRLGAVVTAWLSGGTEGEISTFRVAWITSAGRADDEEISIAIASNANLLLDTDDADAAALKAAFPKFAAVADPTIEFWLTRARRAVDDSWCEDDRQMGEMLLAAHYLTLEGFGTGAEAQLAAEGMAGMQQIRSGQLALQKSGAMADAAAGSLDSTSYGQRYLELLRQNRGGPRVAPTGALPDALLYEPIYYVGSSS